MQDEKRAWDTLLSNPPLPPISDSNSANKTSAIDANLLDDPEQAAILALLNPTSNNTALLPRSTKRGTPADALRPQTQHDEVQQRLRSLAQNLEPSIDIFADGVHRLAQYRLTAERVADKVLADGASVLETRDRKVKEASGTAGVSGLDALRALGVALSRTGGSGR